MRKAYNFWVYIVTNQDCTCLYTGMTNDLAARLKEHYDHRSNVETFAGRYWCHHLVYYEWHRYVLNAIAREKEIKSWKRAKKMALIESINPKWNFLNVEVCGHWPPQCEGR